jgi:cephalosporin-C deacetylase-like acetyl esterase
VLRHRSRVSERVAQVHDERVDVLGEAAGGGLVAVVLEL